MKWSSSVNGAGNVVYSWGARLTVKQTDNGVWKASFSVTHREQLTATGPSKAAAAFRLREVIRRAIGDGNAAVNALNTL